MKTLDEITKHWLSNNPCKAIILPDGWEFRFGLCGRFLKYESVEHAERKNRYIIRETGIPFGYCNQEWELLKSNLQPGDEIWRYGGNGGEAIYLIRDNQIVKDKNYPKKGYYICLSCF